MRDLTLTDQSWAVDEEGEDLDVERFEVTDSVEAAGVAYFYARI
ncbi:hypothetical protein [Actinomadura sp. KC06]|nr:hypothetical protein [Actinomadura sp. KC06]